MKKTNKLPPQPPSALQTVGALGRELKRLSVQLEKTSVEITKTDEPSRRIALEKLNQHRSLNFARLVKAALAAEEKLGLLVEKSSVVGVWTRQVLEFKSALSIIPQRMMTHALFADLDPISVKTLLQSEVDATLKFLWEENESRQSN